MKRALLAVVLGWWVGGTSVAHANPFEYDFQPLAPDGAVEHDVEYLHLLSDLCSEANRQAAALLARGLSAEEALPKLDLSALAARFAHGDPFLEHRFQDYVVAALPQAALQAAAGKDPEEHF